MKNAKHLIALFYVTDTDFEHPSLLMSGNLEIGFVIIYLFPLVLIAMTFNLYSEEKELGTWRILVAQTSGKAQLSFNKLAGTDMVSHLSFLEALTNFHKNLRESFYTKIFDKKSTDSVDWKNHEAKFYELDYSFSWLKLLLPSLLMSIIIAVLAGINLRRL